MRSSSPEVIADWKTVLESLTRKGLLWALFLVCAVLIILLTPQASFAQETGQTIWRLYNLNTGEHFYTSSEEEHDFCVSAGWSSEGVGWIAPETSSTPVYRLYNPNAGDHMYTTSADERDSLVRAGWRYEGICWYSDDSKAVAVYRDYNPNAETGAHNFTCSPAEHAYLVSIGWNNEGIGWYALAEDQDDGTPIMGQTQVSATQLADFYSSTVGEDSYPADVYAKYGAPTIEDFCEILVEEAQAEGVRAEVLFAQAMLETGWLQFGGTVSAEQCNFGGLGAVDSTVSGASFPDVRTGLRAQVQHLKAYATTDGLVNECVDPRFHLVSRGSAPTLEELNGKWAVPGDGYGESIAAIIERLYAQVS